MAQTDCRNMPPLCGEQGICWRTEGSKAGIWPRMGWWRGRGCEHTQLRETELGTKERNQGYTGPTRGMGLPSTDTDGTKQWGLSEQLMVSRPCPSPPPQAPGGNWSSTHEGWPLQIDAYTKV